MNESQFIQWLKGYLDGREVSAEENTLSFELATIKHNLGTVYKEPTTKYNIESKDASGYRIYGDGIEGRTTNSSNASFTSKSILKG